jgi:hypothetical protein
MNFRFKIAAASILAVSFVACYGQTSETQPPVKQHTTARKAKKTAGPSVAEQIQSLRHELQSQASQIDSLKTGLANKDTQLQRAEQAAANAQAAADKAEAAANAQQQAVGENTAAVTTLQSNVKDLQGVNVSLASSVSDAVADQKKTESKLGPLSFANLKIGATFFADYSYWSDYDGSTQFIDNQTKPSSITDQNYNAFEVTRAYINLFYTPSDAVTLRITPDIYRTSAVTAVTSTASTCTTLPCTPTITNTYATDQSLSLRLKYGYIDLNKLFASNKYFKDTKITFGQTQNSLTDWEEGLTGHRYTYKMPMDYASGLSSTYVGVKAHGPIKFNGKEYLDYDLGIYTNGTYNQTEASDTKQFMGRVSWYPLGTKADRTGLGVTLFGDTGSANVAPSAAASTQVGIDRLAVIVHYQTADKGYLLTGQYDLSHNVKNANNTQVGYAFEGNARLGGAKSPFHAFGLYQYYEPYSNAPNSAGKASDQATQYSRTVGGIAYRFNKNLDIALGDSNLHYINPKAVGAPKNDANVVSVFTQYNF